MAKNFSNLTFEEIKSNLKEYLKQQNELTDYDFEGSAINILLDELAYFGQYMGFYSNLLYQEGNLPTATKRDNVVTKAKELSYFPKQKRSPQAKVHLSIDLTGESPKPESVDVPRGTTFISEKQEGSFNFVAISDFSLTDDNNDNIYEGDVELQEGILLNYDWTFRLNENQRFVIPNGNVDERFLNVFINGQKWNYAKDIFDMREDDTIYFLQEVEDNKIEIEFTNSSKIGVDVQDNDKIEVNYLVTQGESGNNCKFFELISDIDGFPVENYTVETVDKALGGSEEESIESIRQVAPINYQTQNRAVNINDYKALLLSNFPYIQSINVWGGEENDPPRYGQVLISIKPDFGLLLGENLKVSIKEFLEKYKIVGIRPEIIDPEYVFVDLYFDIFYSTIKTSLTQQEIKSSVSNKVTDYFNNNATQFGDVLWQSHLTTFVDDIDNYIISSRYYTRIKRKFTPTPDVMTDFSFFFANSFEPKTIHSNEFGNNFQLKDDGDGNIHLYQNDIVYNKNQGTVDYEEGSISLRNFSPKNNLNETIELSARPEYQDIFSKKNYLLNLENISIDLNTTRQ